MKDKIGFNLIFAILAFPIGLGLLREFDFQTFTFKKTALGIIYLTTFIFSIYFMLKKKKATSEKNNQQPITPVSLSLPFQKKMKTLNILVLLVFLFLTSCEGTKYDYWDLSKFNIDENSLENLEEIKILYSSRGPTGNKDLEYYVHLIVVSQMSGDTVNVLTTADNGFKKSDKDKIFNFFDKENIVSKVAQLEENEILQLTDNENLKNIELKRIYKVARDPNFDHLADNNFPTIIGSIGIFTPNNE